MLICKETVGVRNELSAHLDTAFGLWLHGFPLPILKWIVLDAGRLELTEKPLMSPVRSTLLQLDGRVNKEDRTIGLIEPNVVLIGFVEGKTHHIGRNRVHERDGVSWSMIGGFRRGCRSSPLVSSKCC